MKKLLTVLILIISWQTLIAQGEANIWYFGNRAGLDFNTGVPIALNDSELITQEGSASISDRLGRLQFYTDGVTVWSRDHTIMPNGTGLNGSFSSSQSALIVPLPGSSMNYFIFTVDDQAGSLGLNYSSVDMALNGGLGDVVMKNVQLVTSTLEKITAVKHSNGRDVWVITHKRQSNAFYSYLVTNAGVNETPIVTNLGLNIGSSFGFDNAGYMKSSPDGNKIALVNGTSNNPLHIVDFDTSTGVVSNFINIPAISPYYGVEFSPNSQLLYVSSFNPSQVAIAQFDITKPTAFEISLTINRIAPSEPDGTWGALQLATDGKIYVTRTPPEDEDREIHFLSVINDPNERGAAANFELDAIDLGQGGAASGLPPFIQSFFSVAFESENYCLGEATAFRLSSSLDTFDSVLWDFGDGDTSTDENPTHTYSDAGVYEVTLTVDAGGESSTEKQEIEIFDQPIANLIEDISICDDDNDGFAAFDLTQWNSVLLGSQDPAQFSVAYFVSQTDLDNNIPISDPTTYINSTAFTSQEIIARVTNNDNSDCSAFAKANIQVFESAVLAADIPNLVFCDNTSVGTDVDGMILFDLTTNQNSFLTNTSSTVFEIAYFEDSSLTNAIADPLNYNNTSRSQQIYFTASNPNNTDCQTVGFFSIEVEELPTVNPVINLEQCDDDQDGFSVFNLEETKDEISNNAINEDFTFYISITDAEQRVNPIDDPTNYTNQTVSSDLVYARVENEAGCYRTTEIQLTITTTQIPDSFLREFYACDDGADTSDGVATFDFSSVIPEIESQFPAGQQLVIRFYRNENDALRELNAIVDVSKYENVGYRDQQDIYVRVDSEIDNDCLGLGHHITLNVTRQPEPVTITIPEECDTDGDELFAFDTSTIEAQLTGNDPAFSITYTDQSGATLSSPLPNPFVTSSQTVTARVETNVMAGNTATCFVEIPLVFNVRTAPQAQPVNDLRACDNDQDGMYEFDLTQIELAIINNQTNAVISYYKTDGSPITLSNAKTIISVGERITARLSAANEPSCFTEISFELIVDQQPVANAVDDVFLCLDPSLPLTNDFDLTEFDAIILGTQPSISFTIEYFESAADAMARVNLITTDYTVSNGNTEVFARISNVDNETCFEMTSFSLGVYRMPVANQPNEIEACENEDGSLVTVDLNVQTDEVLNGQSEVDVIVSYHLNMTDAESGINEIISGLLETDQSVEVFVRAENFLLEDCYDTTSFQVEIVDKPILELENEYPLCNNLNSLEIELDDIYDRIEWSTGATTNQVSITEPGNYFVTVYNEYDTVICETFREFTVVPSIVPEIERIDVQDFSQNSNSIEVVLSSQGSFEYSIDGSTFQRSNIFEGLDAGTYEVTVRDISGCGVSIETVIILDYPRFFTPNGDGFNDTWHIENAVADPASQVFIFDRYGKLLGSLTAADEGWDGIFNGNPLPSSDYWFEFKMSDGSSFRGHFSLKR
jgi:gliding motility-associated-like protein